jgi:phosphopantetheine adenylyltransferase / dephospho-CoA kinase
VSHFEIFINVFFVAKILNELIEPCEDRIEKVKAFLMDVDSTLEYAVVPISDPFGPTKDDPTMDVCQK